MPINDVLDTWTEAERVGLRNGDCYNRREFHERYELLGERHGIELIEGVVYLRGRIPVTHAAAHADAIGWLAAYEAEHSDVEATGTCTLLLDDHNEPEPDALMFHCSDGRIEGGYVVGAPELIFEVAYSSASRDLHQKKRAYERNGVREYIVWRTLDGEIDWFQLRDGAYVKREPGVDGLIASEVFPGLRLDVGAVLAGDRAKLLAALHQ
jgi:Uma2 family endonuclease